MVLMKPVPGHERGNAEYLVRKGAAVIGRSVEEVVQELHRLLGDQQVLTRMARASRQLFKPATETIVNAISRKVQTLQDAS
jgi:UDP-N-acetylglucosamine:LPS N-acetylglucosamine transferase